MKLLIVAGGGGHFAAALAVIQQVPKDWEILVVGRKYAFEADKTLSFEYQTCQKLGIKFVSITTGRLQRNLSVHSLNMFAKMPVGFFQSIRIIKNFQPDVVLSFGGYVSVPVAIAAWILKIPIIVHEQTFAAGLANKIVGKFADKICISWEESRKFFPSGKVVLTGNPIRHSGERSDSRIANVAAARDSGRTSFARMTKEKFPIIYITGGSGGAHGINVLIEEILEKLLQKYIVIHQTGDAKEFGDFNRLSKKRESLKSDLQKRYLLTKFVDADQVFSVLEKADLVISRSGINTVTELLALGKPTLFIPLPHGQHNEQLTNALFVKKLGLAEIAEQANLNSEKLFALTNDMIENINNYKKYSEDARKLIHKDAVNKILSIINNVNK